MGGFFVRTTPMPLPKLSVSTLTLLRVKFSASTTRNAAFAASAGSFAAV